MQREGERRRDRESQRERKQNSYNTVPQGGAHLYIHMYIYFYNFIFIFIFIYFVLDVLLIRSMRLLTVGRGALE